MDLFHWDNVNKRLGIKTNTPAAELDVNGNARINSGTTINKGGYDFFYAADGRFFAINGDAGVAFQSLAGGQSETIRWAFPIPEILHGEDVQLTSGTFWYSGVDAADYIDSNTLMVYNVSDGTTTDIDNDTTNITAGTSHSFSSLPYQINTTESEPVVLVEMVLFEGSGGSNIVIHGIQLKFDNAS